ncbi:DUF4304 domain-containing protein [Candidatus Woesearchaeota archaeon]|nr:DUF4304 domain-containing protein [Candidatus Woesearchaeota archaeon]
MSIKVIERMIDYCNELLAAFKLKNKRQISRWLNELEAENKEELAQAKEFGIAYLLSLHGMVANKITQIKRNINNPNKCTALVLNILDSLKSIIDQRKVRDKIIKEVIQPILKSWGYKKIKRAFTKKEGNFIKRLNVYTSRTSDYYDVRFIFEISIKGPNTNIEFHRVEEKWFTLTEDVNINTVKAEVQAHLLNVIKPFLERYK